MNVKVTVSFGDMSYEDIERIATCAIEYLKQHGKDGQVASIRADAGWDPQKAAMAPPSRMEVYALKAGDKIAAIVSYRDRIGIATGTKPGLKDTKDFLESWDLTRLDG